MFNYNTKIYHFRPFSSYSSIFVHKVMYSPSLCINIYNSVYTEEMLKFNSIQEICYYYYYYWRSFRWIQFQSTPSLYFSSLLIYTKISFSLRLFFAFAESEISKIFLYKITNGRYLLSFYAPEDYQNRLQRYHSVLK